MKEIKKYGIKLQATANKTIDILTKHRLVVIFMILGTALAFALIRTGSFLNINRDEKRYVEETSNIQYKEIDKNILNKFKITQQDQDVEVGSRFDPNRQNPFTE